MVFSVKRNIKYTLLFKGEQLSLAIYESSWYDDSIFCQKMKLMIMQRTQQSQTLKAGLYSMNLKTYIKVIYKKYYSACYSFN